MIIVNRIVWYKYLFANKFRSLCKKLGIHIKKTRYKTAIHCDASEAQELIANFVLSGQPAMIARFGSNEALVTADVIAVIIHAKRKVRKVYLDNIYRSAGLFPYGQDTAIAFGELMEQSARQVDLLGAWDTSMQDFLIDTICKTNVRTTQLRNLEPYYHDNPWTSSLEGKKVVVIHPFASTIESQYRNRDKLFENKNILPSFSLRTVKAVQTIAYTKDERFDNWFSALEFMYEEVIKEDFDVAIIGCGAYGFPLAAKIKKYGKVAIHLGGATQLLFGIKGKRWDNHPYISMLYNDYWVRPSVDDKPENSSLVEGSCYW